MSEGESNMSVSSVPPPPTPLSTIDPTLAAEAHVGSVFSGALAAAIAAWLSSALHIPSNVAVWLVGAAGIGVTSLGHWVHAKLYHGPTGTGVARALWAVLILGALLAGAVSCATSSPAAAGCGSKSGQSLETCTYALFGTYVIVEHHGALLVGNASVPEAAKRAIARADAVAAPLMESGRDLALEYASLRAQVQTGAPGADRLALVTAHLQAWLQQAEPALSQLMTAVTAAQGSGS
jgi:hypothetical protein